MLSTNEVHQSNIPSLTQRIECVPHHFLVRLQRFVPSPKNNGGYLIIVAYSARKIAVSSLEQWVVARDPSWKVHIMIFTGCVLEGSCSSLQLSSIYCLGCDNSFEGFI